MELAAVELAAVVDLAVVAAVELAAVVEFSEVVVLA